MTDAAAVHVHVHLVATGSFPLRVGDLLFTDDEVVVPEYAHLMPLFGIARGRVGTVGEQARECYREQGLAGLLDLAERTDRIAYDGLDRVRLYDGWGTRPKVAIDTEEGPPYAYRLHAPVDVDPLTEALQSLGERRGFGVERHDSVGFSLENSLRRFRAGR